MTHYTYMTHALNAQQLKAVHHIQGPLLVLAGAGSGKTGVIIQKISYLIEQCGIAPSRITAVTFTNKAANEMLKRIAQRLPLAKRRGLKISTFHTLGLRILKKHSALVGLNAGFSIFDPEDCAELLKQELPPRIAQDRSYLIQLQQQLSTWKNQLLQPHQLDPTLLTTAIAQDAALVYVRYQQLLLAYNAVDFDDLISLPVYLLQQHQEIKSLWQQAIYYLLIDEYQDSNTSQYTLVKLLVGEHARFTVVGDDDQSIYAWRGARPENLLQLQ